MKPATEFEAAVRGWKVHSPFVVELLLAPAESVLRLVAYAALEAIRSLDCLNLAQQFLHLGRTHLTCELPITRRENCGG